MKKIQLWLLGLVVTMLAAGGVAMAANTVDPQDGSLDVAKSVYDAVSGGHYAYAAALGLILIVALVKRYLGSRISWLHSDVGGTSLTMVGATAGAMATALAGGGPVTWALMKTAMLVGIGAAGGYSVIKKLIIEPLIKPLQSKLPAWAQPIFSIVLWIFDKPDAAAQVEADASAAGQAAVTANPGQGVSTSVGTPTEVK
jgi:hypothetical protein